MIKVFGSIKTDNYIPYVPEEDETCDQHCFDADYCILTVNNTSECLELSHVDRDNRFVIERGSSGSKVSFKVTLPDNNCPAFNDINYTLTLPSGEVLNWKQTESGWEWKQCREGWKKFERSDGITVCMQTFRTDVKINRDDSKKKCNDIGTNLTGVASVEESRWIYEKMLEVKNPPGWGDWYSFMIDGKRECDSSGKCEFVWSDGYTVGNDALDNSTNFEESKKGEDCLCVSYMSHAPSKTINDIHCWNENYQQGYVCGYQLM